MSANDHLLVFLDAHTEIEGWLSLGDGGVTARGLGAEGMPPLVDPETAAPVRIVAIVPGETVSVHWLEVPDGLAPAQAAAAARMMASEVSAQPLVDMHVAVAPNNDGDAYRIVALVPALAMAGWIGRLQALGLDPDAVLPEPLLLNRPDQGFVRHDRGSTPLYRGAADAFSIEPELAELIVRDAPVAMLDGAAFEAGLAEAVAAPPINLRQGAFAKRRQWQIEWKLVRRLALLSLAILIVTLAIQLAAILRYTYGADALEAEAGRVAATALPRGAGSGDPGRQLEQRLTALRGSGAGYGAIAAALFDAVRATPNVEVSAIDFDRDGSLRATVQGDGPATLSALQQRIETGGFGADLGPIRSGGGRPTAEMIVRAR